MRTGVKLACRHLIFSYFSLLASFFFHIIYSKAFMVLHKLPGHLQQTVLETEMFTLNETKESRI